MDPEVEALVDAPLSAHVASCAGAGPHVCPVWYVYEADTFSVLTGGRTLANVRQNPRVALSIERARGPAVEWMVAVQGTATVVEDEARIAAVDRRIGEQYRGGATGDPQGALIEIAVGTATCQRY